MEREKIAKEINRYANKKICIMSTLIASITVLIIFVVLAQFVKRDFFAYGTLVMYAFMIVVLLIAFKFDLNKKLAKIITKDDYIEILKYMSEISDCVSEWKYYESILMIKRTLNEMVYYHIYEADEVFREYLCYLQTFLQGNNKKQMISSEALSRPHLRAISSKLLEQIGQGELKRVELDNLTVEKKPNKKQVYNITAIFSGVCNGVLIVLVLAKVIITVNPAWYECINASHLWRILYNTGIDVVAAVLAMITWKGKQ